MFFPLRSGIIGLVESVAASVTRLPSNPMMHKVVFSAFILLLFIYENKSTKEKPKNQ